MRNILLAVTLTLCFLNADAQNDFKKLDAWVADNAEQMGGRAILMVYKDGHIIYSHAENKMTARQKMAGRFIARRQNKTADFSDFTPTTRIPVASCSKWYSAALVMTFVDEGKLKLTDTVGKYLPALSKSGKGNITIGECLSHETGIKSPELKESLKEMRNIGSMDEAIADIAAMPMEGEPGKTFHYSNTGLQIAGAILEKISGKSFQTLFAERIAKPLNMQNSNFGDSKVALPAGGAYSTPNDYMNFLVMILNKGTFNGKRILSEKSIDEMQINRIKPYVKIAYSPTQIAIPGYGYGEWIMGDGIVSSPGLFGSFPWVNKDKYYAAFLMTFYLNNSGKQERYKELWSLVNEFVSN